MTEPCFLLIDPKMNTILIPSDTTNLAEIIKEAGYGNIKPHLSCKELIAYISQYLNEERNHPTESQKTVDIESDRTEA